MFCSWFTSSDHPMWRAYHDDEWGQPCHDDRLLFEYLVMECMSCGLSWGLMMRKREIFRQVFVGYGTLVWPDEIDIGPEDVWEFAQRY